MRLDQRPTKAAVAVALLLITYAAATEAAAATKGENRQTFGLLYNVVLAATKLQSKNKPSAAAKDAALRTQHIALILSEPSAIAKMADKTTTSGSAAAGDSEIPDKCKGSSKAQCQEAANYLKNLAPEEKQKLKLAAQPASPLHMQINKTVKLMKTLADQAKDYLEKADAAAAIE
ncbi:uncharacterized protein TEOVI_000863700 [Trypanosoma equiperdum]|uniref:Trypanosomal VSG domain containing protein n=1 Tax=Trypanosoma equiperdum TaxID=5694 RepID=A0A1G4I4S8_TRYEQ|nr:hypothetical protein TEOVI_000863700 [Trypanosoma equiperdum]